MARTVRPFPWRRARLIRRFVHRIWNQVRNASRFDTPAYEIVGPIGAGGMGEVYRARDGQLERDVAIKVLPAELVADASRVNRFLQEARAASALDHPHVIAVYDIGEAESLRFMAMELVDGATLRDLTAEGPLERRKAVKIVLQVAEVLTAAHAAGIVHRDLKPENVMVTGSGYAKVLGRMVDHRSDLFSLGCILYELVSGQRAFRGASRS